MKFTRGLWMTRPNLDFVSAIEFARAYQEPGCLHVLASGVAVHGRGDLLAGGTLDVIFTSPMENVIRVSVTHFAGTVDRAPHFATAEQHPDVEILETEDAVSFRSGHLTARVSKAKAGWLVEYLN